MQTDIQMNRTKNPQVASVFESYPPAVRKKLLSLRKLILDVAAELTGSGDLEETLKWGEPSYLVRGGSTIRLGWKETSPDSYAIYFNCNSKLVDSFKQVYPDVLEYSGNRAIVFHRANPVPVQAVRHCIATALQYHKLKHLPLLGM